MISWRSDLFLDIPDGVEPKTQSRLWCMDLHWWKQEKIWPSLAEKAIEYVLKALMPVTSWIIAIMAIFFCRWESNPLESADVQWACYGSRNTEILAIKVCLSLCFYSQSWKNPLDLGFHQETYLSFNCLKLSRISEQSLIGDKLFCLMKTKRSF
jgi:hypothetical protein